MYGIPVWSRVIVTFLLGYFDIVLIGKDHTELDFEFFDYLRHLRVRRKCWKMKNAQMYDLMGLFGPSLGTPNI